MGFIAYPSRDYKLWDYILGNLKMSIATDRYSHLYDLNCRQKLEIFKLRRKAKK